MFSPIPSRRVFSIALAALLLLGVSGCAVSRFTPHTPIRAQGAETQVELRGVEFKHRITNVLRFDLLVEPKTAQLERAALAYPFAEPCGAVLDPEAEQPTSYSFDDEGQRIVQVAVNFDQDARNILEWEGFLDLKFAGSTGCVRIPVGGYLAQYRHEAHPWFVGGGFRLDVAAPAVAGTVGMFSVPFGVGSWIGDARVAVTVAPGLATCHRDLCPTQKEELRSGPFFPASVEADFFPFWGQVNKNSLPTGFGLGARYTLGWARLPASPEPRSVWVHTAHWVPSWVIFEGFGSSLSSDAQKGPTLELELPLGLALANSPAGVDFGFSFGIGFGFVLPQ